MRLWTFTLLISIYFFYSQTSIAGGIRGTIKNTKGEVMPYTSILVKNTSIGTMANEDGKYEVTLKPGTYELQFQYLGYQVLNKSVEVGDEYVTVDVTMQEAVVQLNEVQVGSSDEDAAYTIMRKTISMARFHMLEVDSWSARTYVKGTFRVIDVPFLLKGALKKSNIQVGTTYVLESINEISFQQPDKVKEKAVSIRSNLPPGTQPAINFAQLNIYQPAFFGIILPLSPKAFNYYRFTYEGGFEENGKWVNRIKVTPKIKGQNVIEGSIYIVDQLWSIHSYRFKFTDENGINYNLQQIYNLTQDVWMPIQSEITVKANMFGAEGEARYVTSVRNYQLKINPKYHQQPVVVDEKIDKEKAAEVRKQKINTETALKQKELTRKQLRQLSREMEREDRKERKERGEDVTVMRDYSFNVDTLARKRPSSFWEDERQVPLTDTEIKGYKQADSLYKANEDKIKKDSIKSLPRFRFTHLIFGHTYNYGKQPENEWYPRTFSFDSPLLNLNNPDYFIWNNMGFFNTVEGTVLRTRMRYTERVNKDSRWSLEGNLRYSFERNHLNGGLTFSRGNQQQSFSVSAGHNIFQFNGNNPIPEGVNTVNTLLWERNYMKIYEKTFASVQWNKRFTEKVSFSTSIAFEHRDRLVNRTEYSWFDFKKRELTSNDPSNIELQDQTAFPDHNAWIWASSLTIRPFAKAGIYNGRRYLINNNSPVFTINNRSGFGDVHFNQLELSVGDEFRLLRGGFRYLVRGGLFYGPQKPNYLIDFKHFNGNRTRFQPEGFDFFRLLDYYNYSTTHNYLQAHASQQINRLLFTQFTSLRLYGIRENLFVNALLTTETNVYEVGYGFRGLLKILGAEIVTTFQNGRYVQTGFRLRLGFN
ncbi:DUF5686 and carboxypeptidase regulatory-like domain-containing protein [Xanthocytophaga flava]|uniref:DUF5686 and carboxypeptidase regulatory-like domain-containing protein n=1 Tax=Xanthocytophaga flava TaxID=3048013 RepID=UPI0028D1541D|nr:DUF5686 and carboxypeptidase regulatory-like domain-containing protein [Xanthocytophaga flavus]MDJ1472665.1 DUF5686 and carboxypeptidase regulatory-like domain-containing protein [Xanthocytophaga flavus]